MRVTNKNKLISLAEPTYYRAFFIVGTCLAVLACGLGTTPGGGSPPNTEQKGNWTDRGVVADGGVGVLLALSADGKKAVAAIQNGHIYTSSDFGQPWVDRSAGEVAGNLYWSGVASSSDGKSVSAVTYQNDQSAKYIFTSENSGETWSDRTAKSGDGSGKLRWQHIASSADGTKLVAVVNPGHIYTSVDSGKTWKDRSPASGDASGNLDWFKVASSSNGQRLVAITGGFNSVGGHLFTSDNFGGNWKEQKPIQTDNISSSIMFHSISASSDGNHLIVTGQYAAADGAGDVSFYAKAFTSDNFGMTWSDRPLAEGSDPTLIKNMGGGRDILTFSAASADGSRIAVLVYGQGSPTNLLYTSSSYGKTWFKQTLNLPPPDAKKVALYGVASSSDGRILVFAQAENTLSQSAVYDRYRVLSLTFP